MTFEEFQRVLLAMQIPLSFAEQERAYERYVSNPNLSVRESCQM